jgi:putative membrane protein
MRLGKVVAAGLVLAMTVPVIAQVKVNMKVGRPENFNKVSPSRVGLNRSDRAFMQNAYTGNSFEVKIASLAATRANDPWVKDFAEDMRREHKMANEELKQLARNKSLRLSTNWPAKYTREYRRLAGLHGSAFDRAFTKLNKKGHREVQLACSKELRNGRDTHVRSYATGMLATARSHEKLAMNRQTMMVHRGSYGTAAQPMRP